MLGTIYKVRTPTENRNQTKSFQSIELTSIKYKNNNKIVSGIKQSTIITKLVFQTSIL